MTALGAGGTNGHVILEQPARPAWSWSSVPPDRAAPAVPWILSAKDPAALRGQARKLLLHVEEHPETDLDIAYSLAVTRSAFTHRAAVLGTDREQLLSGLRALADGEQDGPGLVSERARTAKTVLVCSGLPWDPPSRVRLPWEWPVFAKAVAEVDEALRPYLSGSLAGRLGRGDAPPSDEVPSAVVSFGLSVVVARLWRMCGVRPAAYVGEGGPGLWAAAYLRRTCSWEAALDGLASGRGPDAETPPTPRRPA